MVTCMVTYMVKKITTVFAVIFFTISGGPGGDRTLDLRVANAALSQLSYKPVWMGKLNVRSGEGKVFPHLSVMVVSQMISRPSASGRGRESAQGESR